MYDRDFFSESGLQMEKIHVTVLKNTGLYSWWNKGHQHSLLADLPNICLTCL